MSVMQFETVIATASSNANVVTGSAFEFARQRQVVSIGAVASATGGFLTIQSGSDVILEESPPMVLGTMPIIPDHFFYNDVMEIGDRLKIAFRNPTGGDLTLRTVVQINPL